MRWARLIFDAAAQRELDLRLATAAREWLADAERSGRGADDYSAVLAEIVSPAPRVAKGGRPKPAP